MEKRLRSSLQNSAEEFLLSATKSGLKSVKPSLKTLIWCISSSSDLCSSLPLSLHQFVTRSIESFKQLKESKSGECSKASSRSPPVKRLRRSSRKKVKESSDEDCSKSKSSSEKQVIFQNLEIYAHIALLCVSHPKKPFLPDDLLPSVQALHDNLIIFESDPVLLSEIANLCEEWWKEQLPGRETLISQFLPFLLSRSLTLQKKVDVRRIYVLREAFSLFDFDDESIEDLKLLLIRCIITPLYLKTEDGRRFISFLFGLSFQLMKEALAIIRSQIPFGRKSMLEAYADILFRAWKVAEGSLRDEIENGFLQGLIEGAVHASTGSFAASIRRVLGGFITQRTTDGVEKLLFCLAEPVLFRSLQVANSNVRQNALHLLLDMFPLEDPDATKEVKDNLLDKQFFLLERLLVDECPDVRVVAVEGCCRILHLFWEIIPSSIITKTVTKIVDEMSHDLCTEVRISTLNGIIYLLGNPQTHEILKVLLPRLGHLFQDSVLSVRVSVADLLLILRDIRNFQFHKVVNLDALLSSLANDQPLVAQKITRLLMPSYFPSKVSAEEACNRCVTLIKRSPMAGARFCEFALSEGSSPKSLMELVRVSVSLALSHDVNAEQIEGFLVAAANLCHSLVNETSCKTDLKGFFSGDKLKRLFSRADTERAQTSIFNIATIVSPNDVTGLLKECMVLIKKCGGLSDDVERQAEVRSAHKLMLSRGWFDKLFGALTSLLQTAGSWCHIKFGTEMPMQNSPSVQQKKSTLSAKKTSMKSKSVKGKKPTSYDDTPDIEEDFVIAAGAAWQIKDMLTSAHTRDAVMKSPVLELAFSALKVISEVSIKQCMSCGYLETSPVLAYTALVLHMNLQNFEVTDKNDLGGKKNDKLESTRPSLKLMALDLSLNHLFGCTEKLFCASDSGSCCNTSVKSKHQVEKISMRSSFPDQKRIVNMVKMVTAVLKFIVDATSMGLVSHNQERCLQFTSAYVQFIISTLRKHSNDRIKIKEEDLKEALICLKSCFTYAAKLLNLVLKNATKSSMAQPEVNGLANNLLNLVVSIELYLGSKNATCLVVAAKPWLSDLILALGSGYILTETFQDRDFHTTSDQGKHAYLPWLSFLAKIELCELSELNQGEPDSVLEPNTYYVFKKLMEMVILLLRRNPKVLDAVGVIFLIGSSVGLEREEYELVLGLVHFVCVKLVRHEQEEWDELEVMLGFLQKLYPQIEQGVKDPTISDEGREMLESARVLIEPVWMKYMYEDGGGPTMEEEEMVNS
ncbi:Condensin-2 complex subunit G2 [Macleaya cordata]|uniref:Condensin-2 complex subunit G2 n=1 Tax=Macleaya cordata TaxID=56857 RepID=A0A200QAQ6_MACCD|nr:Condensin-2 complex subunit G2 [Macleaya cordata]